MRIAIALIILLSVSTLSAATFTVSNTNATGTGSLQQALLDANAAAGPDTIVFAIPGDGPHVISPTSTQPLPSLTNSTTIDGYTQPGAAPNMLTNGFNAVIKIQLDGLSAGSFSHGLTIFGSNNTVRGLSITRFGTTSSDGISINANADNNTIEGNLIGLNPTGSTVDHGNARNGITITSASGNLIGGSTPAARNVISDNSQYGIYIQGGGRASNNIVQGNAIGLALNGSRDGNSSGGIILLGVPRNTIGGAAPGTGNIISGNAGSGVLVQFATATNNLIQGNLIGPDYTGTLSRSNTINGLWLLDAPFNTIGGTNPGAGNLIALNGLNAVQIDGSASGNQVRGNTLMSNINAGVLIVSGTNNGIRANSIFGNGFYGIDLEPQGFNNGNDPLDGDTGANLRQNYPELTNAVVTRTNVIIRGYLASAPNTAYELDFFANINCHFIGYGEGRFFLGSTLVTTDGNGNAFYSAILPGSLPGLSLTATATDPFGNTSEFPPCLNAGAFIPHATFTVINTNDAGPGSLRQALLDVNENYGSDRIVFNIPGGGVQTIFPLSALPTPLDPVFIDGYTQPGTVPNSLTNGNNSTLMIRLDGRNAGAPGVDGLHLTTSSNTVRGLIIVRFSGDGIECSGGQGNTIQDVRIGSDAPAPSPTSLAAPGVPGCGDGGNGENGLRIRQSASVRLVAAVVNCNGDNGIVIEDTFGGEVENSSSTENGGDGYVCAANNVTFTRCYAGSNDDGFQITGNNNVVRDSIAEGSADDGWSINGNSNVVDNCSAGTINGNGVSVESGTGNRCFLTEVNEIGNAIIGVSAGANGDQPPPTAVSAGTGPSVARIKGTISGAISGTYTVTVMVNKTNDSSPNRFVRVATFNVSKSSTNSVSFNQVVTPNPAVEEGDTVLAYVTGPSGSSGTVTVIAVPDTMPDVRATILPFPSLARVGEIVQATVQIDSEPFAPALSVRCTVRAFSGGRIVDVFPPSGVTVTGPVNGTFTIDLGALPAGGQTTFSVRIVAYFPYVLTVDAVLVGQTDANPGNNASARSGSLFPTGLPSDKNVTVADTTSAGDSLHPISTFTGEVFEPLPPDLDLGGPMRLSFSRYYASFLQRLGRSGRLGHNWRHAHEWSLRDRGTSVEIVTARGRLITFTNSAGSYSLILRRDIPFQLNASAGNFILADPRSQRLYTFDGSGRLTRIDDGHGNTHSLTYTNSILTSVSDGLGRALTFQYSLAGFLTNVFDGLRSVAFTQASSNLVTARDSLGLVTTYAYDPTNAISGLMISATLPEGNVPYRQTFDTAGRVATQTVAPSNTYTLTYVGNLVSIRDPRGSSRRDVHSARGELLAFVDELGDSFGEIATAMDYNTNGQRTVVVDRRGNLTRLAYHGPSGYVSAITNTDGTATTFAYTNRTAGGATFFNLTQVTYADGTSERFAHDTNGNVITRIDRAGKTFAFTHNSRGQVLTAENPLGGVATFTYHSNGALASRDDTDTGTTTFFVDPFSRLTNIVHPDGTSIKVMYDANDRLTSLTDGRTNTYTFFYDDNGNLTHVTDPLSHTAEFVYDTGDRRIRTIDRLGRTADVAYDALEHVVALTNRSGHVTQFSYDSRRVLFALTDPGSQMWNYNEIEGSLISFANPLGQMSRIQRDPLDYAVGLINPLNQTNLLVRDSLHRVTQTIDPLLRTNRFSYDERGLLTNSASPVIGSAGYERNNLGRLSRINDLNGSQWHFSYTPMGRRLSSRDPLGRTNQFAYDLRGRRVRTVFADGSSVSNSFDAVGNRTRRLYSDGTDLQYGFDPRNRLISADDLTRAYDANGRLTNTISSGVSFGAAYDAGGRLTNITYNAGAFAVTYTYDSRNRLISVSDSLTGTQLDFNYDNAGRLIGITRPNSVNGTYTHDAAGRLARIQEGTIIDLNYTLDAAAQITNLNYTLPLDPTNGFGNSSSNWTYDAAHQINSPGYHYDARGRLTNAPGKSFRYDAASRLTQINSATLAYNGANDIVTRSEAGTTTRYFYNHALGMRPIVAEKNDSTGQILRYYVWSPGGTLLYLIDAANGNAVRYFHFDRVGSTLALTDSAGAVTDSYAYTPYGELLGRTGSSAQPFLFVGRYGVRSEPAAALYHMRARYYDPASARFLTRDPVWPVLRQPKSLDPYQYALGDPTRFIDPLGLQSYTADLVPRVSATSGLAGLEERLRLELNSTGEDDPVNQATVDALRKQIDAERKRPSMRATEFIADAYASHNGAAGIHIGNSSTLQVVDGTTTLDQNQRYGLDVSGIIDRSSDTIGASSGSIHSMLIYDNGPGAGIIVPRFRKTSDYELGFVANQVNHNAIGAAPGDERPNTLGDGLVRGGANLLDGCEPNGAWSIDGNGWSGFCPTDGRNAIFHYVTDDDGNSIHVGARANAGGNSDVWADNNAWADHDDEW